MDFIKKYNSQLFFLFSGLIVITIPLKESYNSMSIILFSVFNIYNLIVVQKVKFKISKGIIFFSLPFVFILLQCFYSDVTVYQKNLIRVIPIILFPICFSLLKNQYHNIIEKILKFLVLSTLVYSLFLIVVALYRQFNFSSDFSEINWYFFAYHDFTEALKIHPTYLGMLNCMAFSVILNNIISTKKLGVLNLIFMLVLAIVILLSGSRISLACLVIIFLYITFSNFRIIKIRIKLFFILFFFIVPIVVFTFVPIAKERMIDMTFGTQEIFSYAKYGNNVKYNGSIKPRLELWKCAIETTKSNYFFGNGFGHTQTLLNQCYISKGYTNYSQFNYQTHNQFLSNYARGGFFGLLVLLLVLFIPLSWSVKNKNILYTSFLIIVIVCSFTENILNRHIGIVFYAFFNSLFFFTCNKKFSL